MERETIENLTRDLRVFAEEREWEQFHSPRNLLLALVGEVGELAAELQWLTDEEVGQSMSRGGEAIKAEVADIAIYLFRLSDVLGIDLEEVIREKVASNERRYSAAEFKGRADKAPKED